MSYIRMITGGAFAAVFVLAIFMFAANFAADNDSDISVIQDSRYTALNSSLRAGLNNLSSDAESSQEMLFKTTLESGDEHSSTGAQFKIGPWSSMTLVLSSFNTAFMVIFGADFMFIAYAFVTMITFIIGFFTIKAWLGRSPD